jgi:malic enzyme
MARKITREDALQFHMEPRPGKFDIAPSVPMATQQDLSLAYSPGVAIPCEESDLDEDLQLYERFVTADPPHASPLEHVATPAAATDVKHLGNLRGWLQLRHVALAS